MSFVIAAPEWVSGAATDLTRIDKAIDSARAPAAAPTTAILAAAYSARFEQFP